MTRTRVLAAPQQRVWELIADPEHLPRWWPRMKRVEDVREDRWTEVFMTKRGRAVRIDQRIVVSERPSRRCWSQEVEGTPFERVLRESIIDVRLAPADGGTLVTIAQHQKGRGYSRTGVLLLRRAAGRKLDEALAGLAEVARES